MSAMFDEVVTDFASSLGVSRHPDEARAPFAVELERSGLFCLEEAGEDVLACLVRGYGRLASAVACAALLACHHRHRPEWPVGAALLPDERLMFCARLPLAEASVPTLVASLQTLSRMHDRLDAEGAA